MHTEQVNTSNETQFGFRMKYATTTEQVHRIVSIIHDAQESDQYCTAAFLDISQAFDKVWHQDLLYKIKAIFPDNVYNTLQYKLNEIVVINLTHLFIIVLKVLFGLSFEDKFNFVFYADNLCFIGCDLCNW
jgi:hypothetical protein